MITLESFEANNEEPLQIRSGTDEIEWVKNDTAILVIHGIGNQLPLETLDQFGRDLLRARSCNQKLDALSHIKARDRLVVDNSSNTFT